MSIKKLSRLLISFILTVVLFVGSFSVSVNATELLLDSDTHFDNERLYSGDDYCITFSILSTWEGGYNLAVTINNTGNTPIENWFLYFDFDSDITNIWNAEVFSRIGDEYVIRNAGWNSDILPGESVSFGLAETGSFPGFPEDVSIMNIDNTPASNEHTIAFSYNSEWGEGFVASITISNDGAENIDDWILEFNFDREITSVWNAVLESHEGIHYVIKRAPETFCIAPGQSISFGFIGAGGTSGEMPEGFVLSGADMPGRDHTGSEIIEGPGGEPIISDDEADDDGDGLSNGFEAMIGTDPELEDTDGDLLSDYQELYLTWTDPTLYDTDGNGISDADEDLDGDGLSNIEEFCLGTDAAHPDSDRDDLSDYDEIYVHNTDPLNPDTDGDTLLDGDDVLLGFSPLLPDTDLNGIYDADEKVYQTTSNDFPLGDGRGIVNVSVSMSVGGNIDKEVSIINVYDFDARSRDVVGLIGVPVEIRSDAAFDTATITFTYDETTLGDTPEENLSLMWYDEENHWYQILDMYSVVDTVNNTVSYTTSHFSKYNLVDREKWYQAWSTVPDYPSLLPSPLADLSRSTGYFLFKNVPSYMANATDSNVYRIEQALRGDALLNSSSVECDIQYKYGSGGFFDGQVNYRIASREYFSSLGYSFEIGEGIDHMVAPYLTPSIDEIIESIIYTVMRYPSSYEGKNKAIIWITDGYVDISSTILQSCIDNGISIYVIDVTSDSIYDSNYSYNEVSGVKYYYGSVIDDPVRLISLISQDTNTITDHTDNDLDGLPDIYETIGMQCTNGRLLYSDPNKEDTDGDTLKDGIEVRAVFKENLYIGKDTYRSIYLFIEHSDPSKEDTDGDGIKDCDDTDTLTCLIKSVKTINLLSGANYLRVESFDGGNQGWWNQRVDYSDFKDDLQFFIINDDYRMSTQGCGIVAMSDLELFLAQSYDFHPVLGNKLPYFSIDGCISLDDYMTYADYNRENVYYIDTNDGYAHGVRTSDILSGLSIYMFYNGVGYPNPSWADSCKKEKVLLSIIEMISKNLPVICLYNSNSSSDSLILYSSAERAIDNESLDANKNEYSINSHYMSIIGYTKYLDDAVNCKYLLIVETYGRIYYINFDEFASKLNKRNCNIFLYHI